jgi:hypothetical protein
MIANLLLRISVVLALAGMLLGITMGIREDFTLMPAHAHLNLVGFVSLFLAGLYYGAVPEAAKTAIAKLHAFTSVAGALVFPVGIAARLLGGPAFEPIVVVGALIVLAGNALFACIVVRHGVVREA